MSFGQSGGYCTIRNAKNCWRDQWPIKLQKQKWDKKECKKIKAFKKYQKKLFGR